ncbi:MAG: hypothetical protein AAF533_05145 [Acidobacteriota bacterium]
MEVDIKKRARELENELAALVEEVARRRFGERTWAGSINLPLELDPDSAGRWHLSGPGLLAALEQALGEAEALTSPLQPSRVFCHRCETAGCSHAIPERPTEVFAGYSQTGLPAWAELGQVLLEAGHEDIDQLYERRLLTHVLAGRELKEVQLAAFGRRSKSYDVLQQVVAGYYRLRVRSPEYRCNRHRDPDDRVALSLQAVEHRGPKGETRIDLNVIGRTSDGDDAVPQLVEALGDRVTAPLRNARESLHQLQVRLKDDAVGKDPEQRSQVLGRVPGIMRKLARDLVSGGRRRERRTAHAEQRRRQSRPVQPAVRESLRSTPERTLVDEREGTMVVLGRRNRVHVFAPDGRLVTSLAMEPHAVQRRLRQERWRRATPEEAAELKQLLQANQSG